MIGSFSLSDEDGDSKHLNFNGGILSANTLTIKLTEMVSVMFKILNNLYICLRI